MDDKKMRVLLLVAEAWREDSAGGNVLCNFFEGMDAEFAQVYCDSLLPINSVCTRYFQISFLSMVKSFLLHKPVGRELETEIQNRQDAQIRAVKENDLFNFFRIFRLNIFVTLKQMICAFSNWKTPALEKFVLDFCPDVIFAPCYASPFMLSMTRYMKDLTGKKVATFSGDDHYSLRQCSLSPFYWVSRLVIRRCLKKTFPYYDLYYSMSEDEIRELSPFVKALMKILRKGFAHAPERVWEKPFEPIRLVYAGGLYISRWKILARIGKTLKRINKKQIKMQLQIYSGTPVSRRQRRLLHNGRDIFLHEPVSQKDLTEIYGQSHIALHVESLSLKNRYTTRLSFSTKITDCLKSGCAVMAVAWKEHTGLKYLKENNAAVCVEKIKDTEKALVTFLERPGLIAEYAGRAAALGQKNHNIHIIQKELFNDLKNLTDLNGERDEKSGTHHISQ